MKPGHVRRELIAGSSAGLAWDARGACVLLDECKRRGKYYRPCGAPATHVLRQTSLRGGREQRRTYQLCEQHAREAARQWRLEFPEVPS
jgi:hypothetical protein